mmetsp:Transcript_117950/g.376048  ORF Transcript_117950/g.376048 Transcript_117950/m.376048 type:complete len:240 (-) Transcript_117950:789-1508(-)
MVGLCDRQDRIEQRRARAKNSDVSTMHSHRLGAIHRAGETELLDGGEVMAAVAVDLRRALLDDVLHTQGVQAVLHGQGQHQRQVQSRHVHLANTSLQSWMFGISKWCVILSTTCIDPADERRLTHALRSLAVAEEELAASLGGSVGGDLHRECVLRAIVHRVETAAHVRVAEHSSPAPECVRVEGQGARGRQKLREFHPGEHGLKLGKLNLSVLLLGWGPPISSRLADGLDDHVQGDVV